MEIVLRCEKAELCIDYTDRCVGFTVLDGDKQLDFVIESKQWKQLTKFIDDQIWDYEHQKKEQ